MSKAKSQDAWYSWSDGGKGYCISTHGGAGYASGTYWDGDNAICGKCGARIHNPPPTGGKSVWVWEDNFWGRLHLMGHYEEIDTWPDWFGGTRGKPHA